MNNNENMVARMERLENKLDLVLGYVNQQRLRSEMTDDLLSDLSLIGKDIYNCSVAELEKRAVEIDTDEISEIGVNLLKNVGNFSRALALMTSMSEQEDIPKYSIWKTMREMNSPEMKSALGFIVSYIKRLAQLNKINT